MATSHGLSPPFSRPPSSTNHDSNIFIPSLSNTTASLKSPTDCQFSSLEELLSATGIPTDNQQQQPPLSDTSLKRPLVPDGDEAAASPKRPRLSPSLSSSTLSGSSSTLSASLPSSILSASLSSTLSSPSVTDSRPSPVAAQGLIPSILSHSSLNHSKLPTILPASTTQSVLPAISNSLSLPAVTSTLPNNSIVPQLSTTVNASMALLAQLFRQYQAIGDEPGMQKTRQQLLSLIAKTSHKPASSDQPVTLSLSIPNSAASSVLTTTSMPALAPQLTNSTTVASSSGATLSNSPSLLSSTSSLLPLATSKPHSPSIVTQPPPQSSSASSTSLLQNVFPLSAVAGSNKSLPSLHITPQTQTNIMRAVYSYRLKQIQDFISSLPPQQRPTTTQGLRDLLVKHNMAAKLQTIPQSLLVQLQQSSQTSSSTTSTTGSVLTTSDAVSAATPSTAVTSTVSSRVLQSTPASQASVQSLPAATTPQTVSLTASSSTPSTSSASPILPGVTVETLRTLCRLPSNSLSRIPMHRTLMGIVQYLRARGWAGNRVELPALLQQAQEAVNKGQLTSEQQQTLSTATPNTQQQAGASPVAIASTASSLLNSRPSATSSSPLSQYMASVGMKVPRPDLTQSTPTGVRPYNNAYTRNSTSSGLLNRAGTNQAATPSGVRPFTRYQLKVQQDRVEHERLAALQKVLQSSEEARIAFRFQAHMEKLHQQLCGPDAHRGFSSNQDVVLRLVPYHVWAEPELPPGAVEKADAVYEGIASVLLSRAQGLMSRYDRCILRDEEHGGETEPSAILLERLFLEGEKERKEEEERQRRAEETATTGFGGAPHVGGGNTSQMSTDPFLLDSDPFSDDPFLPHFWSPDLSADHGTGIT